MASINKIDEIDTSFDGVKTPSGWNVLKNNSSSKASPTFLSFPDSLKTDENLYKNCLHFACVDPITTSTGVQALSTSYRAAAINYSENAATTPTQKHLLDIYLYKPLMVTKLAHTYEAVKSNIIDDIIKGMSAKNDTPASNGKTSQASDKPAEAGIGETAGKAYDAAETSIIGGLTNFFNEAASSAKQQTTGKAYITPSAAMYKGTAVRTQAFNFKFNPRNQKDLEAMAQIIYYFHYFSLPTFNAPEAGSFSESAFKSKGATYYDVPKLWYIDEMFGSTEGKDIKRHTPRFIFGPAAITNIEYNMTPDEFSKTLKGTAADPAAIDLSITFTELIPMDSEMYDKQNSHTEVHSLGPNVKRSK